MFRRNRPVSKDVELPKTVPSAASFNGKDVILEEANLRGTYPVNPGDTFNLIVEEDGMTVLQVSEEITEPMVIDRAVIFRLENELGFKKAIAGAFGEKE